MLTQTVNFLIALSFILQQLKGELSNAKDGPWEPETVLVLVKPLRAGLGGVSVKNSFAVLWLHALGLSAALRTCLTQEKIQERHRISCPLPPSFRNCAGRGSHRLRTGPAPPGKTGPGTISEVMCPQEPIQL